MDQKVMDQVQQDVLFEVAGIRKIPPQTAFSLRVNGSSFGMGSSEHITILPKPDGKGFDMHVKSGTKQETAYIPVVVSNTGHAEQVYNDFFIGEDAEVTIIAGCGIHNGGERDARHDGVHSFHVGRGATVRYIENHYGSGEGSGERVLNPVTNLYLQADIYVEVETVQIGGVSATNRLTRARVGDGATLVVKEKLLTEGRQTAETNFEVDLAGVGSSANVISRSVAKGFSEQCFFSKIDGNKRCSGHSECDAILMDSASVKAIPEISANHVDAALIHEAAIGKIAGEQITKLRTLGLTEEEAEEQIIRGFLK